MINLAVFASGKGSNLNSILQKSFSGNLNAKVEIVISNRTQCGAFELADRYGIKKITVSDSEKEGAISYSELEVLFTEREIDLIVLAGYLKKLPESLVNNFKNKVINIHPALLPSFGGKGMYGMNVHTAVFSKSCQVSGATVHFVDNIYDNGKIIAQRCVDISDAESPEEIAQRVLEVEHELLPYVIQKFSDNKVIIGSDRVRVLN
ncbi:MAG: phosphoribosylglycinamide formyltransferase [Melioribacteraceae bacterium]|nr:phosphoribosylglycinamide formyltransferase [Melioribacteraceae bacterium]